jgi:endonuclease V-like protein UPF0215 family
MPRRRRVSNLIGFDDAPFDRDHRGDVLVVGTVFAGARLEGVLRTKVRRDGANATSTLAEAVLESRFHHHCQAILLQGISLAGFNVVDVHELHHRVGRPVIVVARRAPNLPAIQRALTTAVRGGARKWKLIQRAGPMEAVREVWVQRAGISMPATEALLDRSTLQGKLPEPLRVAHIIAGGIALGESRGRA